MKINKFKKIGSNKYRIYFDNETLVIDEDVILKYNLLYKKDIDTDLLLQINEDNYKASIYDSAIRYIGIRMRSIKEVKEYLNKKKYDNKDIESVVNKLIEQGLLNDKKFAISYVNDKIYLTKSGPDKIKNELIKLGINEKDIHNVFNNIDNGALMDKLNKIIDKEIKLNVKLPINKMKNKIITRCINLGYKYEDIIEILNTCNLNSNSDIKSEYDKLYKRYSNKYSDEYKLKTTIKSKLYQKGYSIEEINKIIE